jgi:acetoin utilization protein AcuB
MAQHLIRQHMTASPVTVRRDATIAEAQRLMREHEIRHLPVLDGQALVGVLSKRDLLFIETLHTLDPETALVEDAMSHEPLIFAPETPLAQVAKAMAETKYGSVVIVERGAVVGMFTNIDALRVLADLAG